MPKLRSLNSLTRVILVFDDNCTEVVHPRDIKVEWEGRNGRPGWMTDSDWSEVDHGEDTCLILTRRHLRVKDIGFGMEFYLIDPAKYELDGLDGEMFLLMDGNDTPDTAVVSSPRTCGWKHFYVPMNAEVELVTGK